jgi:hypothetical protein
VICGHIHLGRRHADSRQGDQAGTQDRDSQFSDKRLAHDFPFFAKLLLLQTPPAATLFRDSQAGNPADSTADIERT